MAIKLDIWSFQLTRHPLSDGALVNGDLVNKGDQAEIWNYQ
jgi:hypothetical protein